MIASFDRAWDAAYGRMTDADRRAIDNAFDVVRKALRSAGFVTHGNARAEALIAGITRSALGTIRINKTLTPAIETHVYIA